MSRTEFKILKEGDFWAAIFKPPHIHSDQIKLLRAGSELELSPVHRLDHETQGLLLLARQDHWQKYHSLFLESSASSKTTQKVYLASTNGEVPLGVHSGFIGSRYRSSKKTRYAESKIALKGYHSLLKAEHIVKKADSKISSFFDGNSYVVQLISGRRHQIRAFFAEHEAPLIGDILYGSKIKDKNLALFSWKLLFEDPISRKKIQLEAKLEDFQKV